MLSRIEIGHHPDRRYLAPKSGWYSYEIPPFAHGFIKNLPSRYLRLTIVHNNKAYDYHLIGTYHQLIEKITEIIKSAKDELGP